MVVIPAVAVGVTVPRVTGLIPPGTLVPVLIVATTGEALSATEIAPGRTCRKLKGGLVIFSSCEEGANSARGRPRSTSCETLGSGNKIVDHDHGVGRGSDGSDE